MSENVQVVTDLPAKKNFFARIPAKKAVAVSIVLIAATVVAKVVEQKLSNEESTDTTETTAA